MLRRDDAELGTKMRLARKEKGWTLEEFAKKISVHKVMPGRYELGGTIPSNSTLAKINEQLFEVELESTSDLEPSLATASVEELIEELKNRGATKVIF